MPTPLTVIDQNSIPARIESRLTPALFADRRKTMKHFWEFFAAQIANDNTREAYMRAVYQFADWCEGYGIFLIDLEPTHVAAYIRALARQRSPATTKQHLAAIRMLFDWLVINQVIASNPATAVKGPKHVVRKGKTPVLNKEELRELFDSIETDTVVGLRDRALIGLMVYSFARVSAATSMTVGDYYIQGKRAFFRLHEKGGKYHKVPAHHTAQEYLDAYIEAASIGDQPKSALFRSSVRGRNPKQLTERSLTRETALQMIKRRAKAAGLPSDICNHTFRGSGITVYLNNGGTIENAAAIAAHESTRTTQLYDRTDEELSLDEIEKIHV